MERTGKITGTIEANPNPLFFGQGNVVISWETNDPTGGEVRVSTSPGDEKLVSKSGGQSGRTEIPWIVASTVYEFRLYAASKPDAPVDSVQVRRAIGSAPIALRELSDEIGRGNVDMSDLSQFIAAAMPACLHSPRFRELFRTWERRGFHVTPVHFYQPIPDTQELPEALWNRPSKLAGINMNAAMQLDLLRKYFPEFRAELEAFPAEPTGDPARFYLNNGLFDGMDAFIAYCVVRHFHPRLIVEVGSGFSSLILGEALARNNGASLICVEPYPQDFLRNSFTGLGSLIETKVQDVGLELFSRLASGDILFIDSSHTVKIGGDVNYLFLEVLPRLEPGVIVHIHDIFFPFEYRRDWVMNEFRFWSEQYLLQAFLTFNSEFEVLIANSYLSHYHEEVLKAAFPSLPSWGGGSFWMRRKPSTGFPEQSELRAASVPGFHDRRSAPLGLRT
jgi:Methyltransferase domain